MARLAHPRHSPAVTLMRWPWQPKPEQRESTATDYTALVSRLIMAQAEGQTVEATATAAVEAASGALSRAFAAAGVQGPEWVQRACTPRFLAQVGRDLVRQGETLHVIRVDRMGRVHLVPCSTWYWEGDADPATWFCTATAYGPSGSETWRLPYSGVVFASWGTPVARPYHGLAPTSWAAVTARIAADADKSLADEAGGPLAQLLAIPSDGGDGSEGDPLAGLKADIGHARGKALLVETTAAGWGEGRTAAPQRDYLPARLGPAPPAGLVELRRDAFNAVLAACGTPPSLFTDADGTSQREALRRWHLGTVLPLAKLLEHELSAKFEVPVGLTFDSYPKDMVSRAQVFAKLVAAEGVSVEKALEVAGLVDAE